MFSPEAESAYLALQREAIATRDTYELDRIDRALDEILRNPLRSSPAAFQYRSAMAHAAQVIADRRRTAPIVSPGSAGVEHATVEPGFAEVEASLWIEAMPVPDRDRAILHGLAADVPMEDLAPAYRLTVPRMREAVSRVRARARQCRTSVEAA